MNMQDAATEDSLGWAVLTSLLYLGVMLCLFFWFYSTPLSGFTCDPQAKLPRICADPVETK